MKRFFSFLGTGNYQPCRYRFGERTGPEVVYVQTATAESLNTNFKSAIENRESEIWNSNQKSGIESQI